MNENGQSPVTKADLQSALEQFFKRTTDYIDGRIQTLSEHFDERIYDTETKLLRAFSEYATASDVRLRKVEANLGNLDTAATLRLAQLEAAVTELRARVIQLEDRPH